MKKKNLLEHLETRLVQSVERLDRGEGVEAEKVFRRLRNRIKKALKERKSILTRHPQG